MAFSVVKIEEEAQRIAGIYGEVRWKGQFSHLLKSEPKAHI